MVKGSASKNSQTKLSSNDLLAAASHELKTPLTVVTNIASALRGGLFGDVQPDQRQQLERIELTSQRLLQVVDGILGLEKVRNGRMSLNLQPVNLMVVSRTVVKELSVLADESMQKVIVETHSIPPVYADPVFVHQVLFNLLHNALRYSPHKSTITIRAKRQKHSVCIIVADEAPRLSKSDRGLLFEKFSPLSSRSAQPGSNGLGLYLCAGIATLLGGNLQHFPGRNGNRFHFQLPVAQQLVLFSTDPV